MFSRSGIVEENYSKKVPELRVTEKNFWLENVSTIKFLRDGNFIVMQIEREDGMK